MSMVDNYSIMNNYLNINRINLKDKYEELLLGKVIERVSSTFVEYHIKNFITLNDKEQYETHFRWSTKEERKIDKEIVDNSDNNMECYFKKYILNRKIIEINIGYDKDDYIYAYAKTDCEGIIEIPIISVYEIGSVIS